MLTALGQLAYPSASRDVGVTLRSTGRARLEAPGTRLNGPGLAQGCGHPAMSHWPSGTPRRQLLPSHPRPLTTGFTAATSLLLPERLREALFIPFSAAKAKVTVTCCLRRQTAACLHCTSSHSSPHADALHTPRLTHLSFTLRAAGVGGSYAWCSSLLSRLHPGGVSSPLHRAPPSLTV